MRELVKGVCAGSPQHRHPSHGSCGDCASTQGVSPAPAVIPSSLAQTSGHISSVSLRGLFQLLLWFSWSSLFLSPWGLPILGACCHPPRCLRSLSWSPCHTGYCELLLYLLLVSSFIGFLYTEEIPKLAAMERVLGTLEVSGPSH